MTSDKKVMVLHTVCAFAILVSCSANSLPCSGSITSINSIATNFIGNRGQKSYVTTSVTGTVTQGGALCFEVNSVTSGQSSSNHSAKYNFTLSQPIKYTINFETLKLRHRLYDIRKICSRIKTSRGCFCDCAGAADGNKCGLAYGYTVTPTATKLGIHHEANTEGCPWSSKLSTSMSNTCCDITIECEKDEESYMFDISKSQEKYGFWKIERSTKKDGEPATESTDIHGNMDTIFSSGGEDKSITFQHIGQFNFDSYHGNDRIHKSTKGIYRVSKDMWNSKKEYEVSKGDWYKTEMIGTSVLPYDANKFLNAYKCKTRKCSPTTVDCTISVVEGVLNLEIAIEFSKHIQPFGHTPHFDITDGEYFEYQPHISPSSMFSVKIKEPGDITLVKEQASAKEIACSGVDNHESLSSIRCHVSNIQAPGLAQIRIEIDENPFTKFDIVLPRAERYDFNTSISYGGNKTVRVCLGTEKEKICSNAYNLVDRVETGWNPFHIEEGSDSLAIDDKGVSWEWLSWLNPVNWFNGMTSWFKKLIGIVVDIAIIAVIIFIAVCCFKFGCCKALCIKSHKANSHWKDDAEMHPLHGDG